VMAEIVERRRAPVVPPAAEKALDPICGMEVTVAGARHTADVAGTTYYFCCGGCRAKFLQMKEER